MENKIQRTFCLPKDDEIPNLTSRSSHNPIPCFADGHFYPSLNSMSVDMELDFSWLYLKLKKNNFEPVTISNHLIVLKSWLDNHPEYNLVQGDKK